MISWSTTSPPGPSACALSETDVAPFDGVRNFAVHSPVFF